MFGKTAGPLEEPKGHRAGRQQQWSLEQSEWRDQRRIALTHKHGSFQVSEATSDTKPARINARPTSNHRGDVLDSILVYLLITLQVVRTRVALDIVTYP